MNVMAAICNSFSGRPSFASLTRSPGLNERAPVEEAGAPLRPIGNGFAILFRVGGHRKLDIGFVHGRAEKCI